MPVVKADGTSCSRSSAATTGSTRARLRGRHSAVRPATDDEIRAAFGAGGGSLGPVGVDFEVVADETLREGQFVAGANRDGCHLRGVEAGRDYQPTLRRPPRRRARATRCPHAAARSRFQTAIEVGHIFKLGTFYSEALGATFLDEDGSERPLVMGSYGIGLARTMAAVVEQHHDENGIAWPETIAPYEVHVVALPGAEEIAAQAAAAIEARGRTVLLDDRDQRAGEKFADADLIGCPVRVTAGKKSLEDGARRHPGPRHRRGDGALTLVGPLMPRKRRFSDEPFGPTIQRLMAEQDVTYRALADKTGLSAGYLNHLVHGNRPVPSDDVIARARRGARRRAGALPRGPHPAHRRAARDDARPDRPALQAPSLIQPVEDVRTRTRLNKRLGADVIRP